MDQANWKLLTIESDTRVIEAEYVEGRLAGFVSRAKQHDEITGFRLRERLGNLLHRLAGFVDGRNVNCSIRVGVIKVERIGISRDVSKVDLKGSTANSASKPVAVGANDASTTNIHFDIDLLGQFVRPGKRIVFYFPA
ncbi:hypothetical protein UXJ26_06055 [Burkholderia multivorans]|uniref:Bacteriophage protein n=1 Tax=Burkholderia multivorans (strain ATCC 17616 / 249) TaxID=395019 RepID=A0A0H3KMP6_BURM1|nr:hypothetical protein [Burkholderia multivorans]YP_355362.1 gp27 [Burkholderia phage Bcep176]ABA60028.1 gp27 [Burkholderia phage Bcep176]ABX17527.1 hypothetical protein Bmul_3844 [Burkholderia multivorans ATCC 17616]PRF62431.1 hypothetical protein C6Q28_10665 [Burkholderia multivorans]BAG46516.1 bacteriophage protein [Burkholderia multivorans ATCC 17616]